MFSQNSAENDMQMVMLTELTPGYDLTEHWYWSGFIKEYGKKSIARDSLIEEGYRLLYWGDYFSIVELIKKGNDFEIIVDSTPWNDHKIYRSIDTLLPPSGILNIRELCSKLISESGNDSSYVYEIHEDDRDNWAFEWKYENTHYAIEGIEVSQDFYEIIHSIMELGNLSGYTIYNRHGGKYNE